MRFLTILLIFFLAFSAFAQTASELRSKIDEKSSEIARLEAEIKTYRQELQKLGRSANTLANSIKELDLNQKKLEAQVKVTEKQIEESNLRIKELELGIGQKEIEIETKNAALGESLRSLSEIESKNVWEIMLSGDEIAEVWRDVDSIKQIDNKLEFLIEELKDIKADLLDTKTEEETEKRKLEALKRRLNDEKRVVLANKQEKQNLLKITKNKESDYNKLLKEKLAKKAIAEKEIEEYEAKLKFILDPKTLPGKGVLAWPLDYILITQKFGKTTDSGRLYTSGTHNGVDFRASTGTPVKAMGNGTIAGTGDTDATCPGASFGRWVLIKYDNGLASTFGHLSVISATTGGRVSSGQVVGYSGNTGYSTAPHLHVTVYAAAAVNVINRPSKACAGRSYTVPVAAINAYLDPLYYLPKTTSSMYK